MKTIKISESEIQGNGFVTPPENGGQIVTRSYACTETYILERTFDASDRGEKIVAYHWPASGKFEPWNGTPKTGRRAGTVQLVS